MTQTTDNFNYICADCGPHEGDPYATTPNHEDFCEGCWKYRQQNASEEKYEDEQWKDGNNIAGDLP